MPPLVRFDTRNQPKLDVTTPIMQGLQMKAQQQQMTLQRKQDERAEAQAQREVEQFVMAKDLHTLKKNALILQKSRDIWASSTFETAPDAIKQIKELGLPDAFLGNEDNIMKLTTNPAYYNKQKPPMAMGSDYYIKGMEADIASRKAGWKPQSKEEAIEVAQAKKAGRKTGDTRKFQKGTEEITQEWTGDKWEELGKGPKFKGETPAENQKQLTTKHQIARDELTEILRKNRITGFRLDEWMMLRTKEEKKAYMESRKGSVLEKLGDDDKTRFEMLTDEMEKLTDQILGIGKPKGVERNPLPTVGGSSNDIDLGKHEGRNIVAHEGQIFYADELYGTVSSEKIKPIGETPTTEATKVGGNVTAPGGYKTPEDVKAAFSLGRIKREEAQKILIEQFGMTQ